MKISLVSCKCYGMSCLAHQDIYYHIENRKQKTENRNYEAVQRSSNVRINGFFCPDKMNQAWIVISSVLSINICRYEHDMIESASQQEHIYKVTLLSWCATASKNCNFFRTKRQCAHFKGIDLIKKRRVDKGQSKHNHTHTHTRTQLHVSNLHTRVYIRKKKEMNIWDTEIHFQ
jgi:hypothetical protein